MLYYLLKVIVTSVLVVAISEVAKRSTLAGAILASVPIISVLALVWLYLDTGDTQLVGRLSFGIFWMVLPSLGFFLLLPALLRAGWAFVPAMALALASTVGLYFLTVFLGRLGGLSL